jgi:hypothetical protein
MKFRLVTVVAAAAALSLAAAGSAAAQPLRHKPAPPPQVTGVKLQSAMLPPADFGAGYTFLESYNSGRKLQSTRPKDHVARMSCGTFEGGVFVSDFGDTAGAVVRYSNPNWRSAYPSTILLGDEYVLQFATTASATTFYNQARAKYAACVSFNTTSGFGPATVNTASVAKTTVAGHQAFLVTQGVTFARFLQTPFYLLYLYVVAGTNVYYLSDASGTNDEPSVKLMTTVIHRVQALYPHH